MLFVFEASESAISLVSNFVPWQLFVILLSDSIIEWIWDSFYSCSGYEWMRWMIQDSILDVDDVKAIMEYMMRPDSPLRVLWMDCGNRRWIWCIAIPLNRMIDLELFSEAVKKSKLKWIRLKSRYLINCEIVDCGIEKNITLQWSTHVVTFYVCFNLCMLYLSAIREVKTVERTY